jgi:hypothetical protein
MPRRRRTLIQLLRPLHRLARQLHERPIPFLFWTTVGTLVIGAAFLYAAEHNGDVRNFWDALFLAGASATTSETYDIAPHAGVGKLLTVLLGFAGITLSGCFVAAVTAIIIQGPEPEYEQKEYKTLVERLDRIEACIGKIEQRVEEDEQRMRNVKIYSESEDVES